MVFEVQKHWVKLLSTNFESSARINLFDLSISHTLLQHLHFPGVAAMIFSLHVTKMTACMTPVNHPAAIVDAVSETLKCINIRLSGFGLQQMGKHFVAEGFLEKEVGSVVAIFTESLIERKEINGIAFLICKLEKDRVQLDSIKLKHSVSHHM